MSGKTPRLPRNFRRTPSREASSSREAWDVWKDYSHPDAVSDFPLRGRLRFYGFAPAEMAGDIARTARAAHDAALANRQGGEREDRAIEDLSRLGPAADRFLDEVERRFRSDPWSTEPAHQDLAGAYRDAELSIHHARVPQDILDSFRRLQQGIDDLRCYYDPALCAGS